MTPDIPSRFALLVAALAQRIGAPLDPGEGTVILADDDGTMRLVVELAASGEALHAVVPFLAFADAKPLGEVALQLLQLNADREALRSATIVADGAREQFSLVATLPLQLEPVPFIEMVEALVDLAPRVRAYVVPPEEGSDGGIAAVLQNRA